jgi:hypothetical protein
VLISGGEADEAGADSEVDEVEIGTVEAGAADDDGVGCAADGCAASGDGAALVDELLAVAGDVAVELAAGTADCGGAAFCADGGAASVCGAGVCAAGAAVEPDCGAGVELDCAGGGGGGFGCFTSDGGGSSCVSGGVLFCGGDDCARHGCSVQKAAQNSTAWRKRARYTVSRFSSANLRGAPVREGQFTATVLIRPPSPDASVRNPRVPTGYN